MKKIEMRREPVFTDGDLEDLVGGILGSSDLDIFEGKGGGSGGGSGGNGGACAGGTGGCNGGSCSGGTGGGSGRG